ncbi:PIR Superfamily Protein [Plasmodium ovale curtisi]|nr:PIR Superfamily Protein [Plasmodium ovale curtisi]SBT00311.1 PIR Superfamily Protein [Plasmodium ovale curtisi]
MEKNISRNDIYKEFDSKENLPDYTSLPGINKFTGKINDRGKQLGAQLIRNYKSVLPKYKDYSFNKCCRYLNTWLEEKINTYSSETENIGYIMYIRVFVNGIWEDMLTSYPNINCARQEPITAPRITEENKNIEDELLNVCDISEYYKEKADIHNNFNKCSQYHEYFNNRKDYLSKKCTKHKTGDKYIYPCHISDNCTMNNMNEIFPLINCVSYSESKPLVVKNVFLVFITFFAVFVIFLLLYKHGALGIALSKNKLRSEKIKYIFRDDTPELLERFTESEFEDSDVNNFYVTYQHFPS